MRRGVLVAACAALAIGSAAQAQKPPSSETTRLCALGDEAACEAVAGALGERAERERAAAAPRTAGQAATIEEARELAGRLERLSSETGTEGPEAIAYGLSRAAYGCELGRDAECADLPGLIDQARGMLGR